MPSIFQRINDVLTANINDLIDRVEDPERMVKQIIREMEAHIAASRDGVLDAMASEKKLLKELEDHRRQSEECTKRRRPPCAPRKRTWREPHWHA